MSDITTTVKPEFDVVFVGTFNSISDMKNKPFLPEKGHVIFCEKEKENYMYNGEEWVPIKNAKVDGEGFKMSLYELNKSAIASLPDLEITLDLKKRFADFKEATNNEKYYMLLCRDCNYYTIFTPTENKDGEESFADAVLDCAACLGTLKSVDEGTGYMELWCETSDGVICALLFPYEQGVVKYNA